MQTNTTTSDLTTIEQRLASAGIPAVTVERCAPHGCPWCGRDSLPIAA